MTHATVLIPTHTHADTLSRAVASVQQQTLAPSEILIIGDGVPDRTREIVAGLQRDDPRLRFFDHPKGPRHGERYRHAALAEAQGDIICYLSDDDLWLPHHLRTLAEALAEADFAHTVQVAIQPGDTLYVYPHDLADPAAVVRLLAEPFNFFGLSAAGHTRAAYQRLPFGWRTTPAGLPTDLYMWRQFLAEPWCRARTVWHPSVLNFPASLRQDWSPGDRLAELDRWASRLADPAFGGWFTAMVMRLVEHGATLAARDAAMARLYDEIARCDALITAQTQALARRDETLGQQAQALSQRDQALQAQAQELAHWHAQAAEQAQAAAELRARVGHLETHTGHLEAHAAGLAAHIDRLTQDLARRDARLDAIYRSRLWRLGDRYWRIRRALGWDRRAAD
jgi:hypothetical protein